jgi:hypothetical protein
MNASHQIYTNNSWTKLKELGGAFVAWIVEASPPALQAVLAALVKLTKMGQWLLLKTQACQHWPSLLSNGANAFWDWITRSRTTGTKAPG